MSDLTYWEKRFLQTKASQLVNTKDYEEAMQPKLNGLQHELDVELTKYYRRYSQTNDIPEDETRRILNNIGNSNWSMTLNQFKQKAIEGGHEKELDSEYFKSRIARLQNLETQFKQHTASFGEKHSKSLGNELAKQFNDSYMRTTYTTQLAKQHFTSNFAHFNEDQMKVIVGKPWKGSNFSDRIWKKYRDDIPNKLMDSLLRGTLLGYPPNKITSMLHEQFTNIKKSDVHRLVISELSHVTEEATAQSYEESGIDEYEYMATLESHTCVVCAHLDGMVFKMSERKDGINYPLIHPYCRCTTVPYIKDLPDVKERWMRDSGTGKGKVINNMSYDKWQKQYSNGSKSGAINHDWDNKPAYGDHDKIAYKLYEEFTNRKKLPQVKMVSKNTGYSVNAISEVFDHVFVNKHYFDNGKYQQFDPDYDMSQSWQHLITNGGNSITKADIIMLEHELYESILMNDGLTYETAHRETDKIYNYRNQLMKEGRVYD